MSSHNTNNDNNNNNNQYTTPPSGVSQASAVSNSTMMAMMRNNATGGPVNVNAATSVTGGGVGVGVGGAGGGGPGHLLNQLQARMGQILDDADHRRCSEGNQRALLAEKLENLRQLTKELEKDEWMYAPKKSSRNNGLTLSKIPSKRSAPF